MDREKRKFFGKEKERVWQNAIRWNKITDGKDDNYFYNQNPPEDFNPFKNGFENSGSIQDGRTPGFWSQKSNVFKFGEKEDSSKKAIERWLLN